MNFIVQSLIQDLENMGRFPGAVSTQEWEEKWKVLKELKPAEYEAVKEACTEGFRQHAWTMVERHDPDPAKTQRSSAFEGLFKI